MSEVVIVCLPPGGSGLRGVQVWVFLSVEQIGPKHLKTQFGQSQFQRVGHHRIWRWGQTGGFTEIETVGTIFASICGPLGQNQGHETRQ